MKAQLEALVAQMCHEGVAYSAAVREFKRTFVSTVLRANNGNQLRDARELRMHRNTLSRAIDELDLDVRSLRGAAPRRPPQADRAVLLTRKERG